MEPNLRLRRGQVTALAIDVKALLPQVTDRIDALGHKIDHTWKRWLALDITELKLIVLTVSFLVLVHFLA
jgi:hypothetical protein